SVFDVVAMGLTPQLGLFKKISSIEKQCIFDAIASVHLTELAHRPINTLSGGQFQRMLFARMALQDAQVILLDEPFAAVDTSTMEILASLLQTWQQNGKTIIAVSH